MKVPLRGRVANFVVVAIVALVVLGGLTLLVRWEAGRTCVRWATRVDALAHGAHTTQVCVEYR